MRRQTLSALAIAVAFSPLASRVVAAQNGGGARIGPQIVSYKLGEPSNITITETAIPVFMILPIRGISVDLGTAFAMANVKSTVTGGIGIWAGWSPWVDTLVCDPVN